MAVVEPNETFTITLGTVTSQTAVVTTGAVGTGTIINDDTDITVTVSPAAVAEDGAPNLVYTFSRNGVATSAINPQLRRRRQRHLRHRLHAKRARRPSLPRPAPSPSGAGITTATLPSIRPPTPSWKATKPPF